MAGIVDVAAQAGVSLSTVSYVASGKRKISQATRDKVRQAALDLGYQPVIDATAPADSSTHVLAVSSPVRPYTDVSNYAAFFFALAMAARRHDYDLLLLMHETGDRELVRVSEHRMVDGIFLLDVLLGDSRAEVAAMLDVPVVSIGCVADTSSVYSVDMDFEQMGRESMEKAYVLGHRHVLLLCPDRRAFLDGSNFLLRFLDTAIQRGQELGLDVTRLYCAGHSADGVNLAIDEALGMDPQISAIICEENAAQMGVVLAALARRNLRVPQDISLLAACTNGTASSRLTDEMPMNPTAVCDKAVEVMMEVLEGRRHDVGHVTLLPATYTARGTMRARP